MAFHTGTVGTSVAPHIHALATTNCRTPGLVEAVVRAGVMTMRMDTAGTARLVVTIAVTVSTGVILMSEFQ